MSKIWAAKHLKENTPIYYIRHKPKDAEACYFFLLVHPLKEKELLQQMDTASQIDLKQFGKVIESGYGDEAPQHVCDWVMEWYDSNA